MRLEVKGLGKTYANGVKALDDVSFDLEPGMFGLLGPNGAGKSTLMRTLATLQDADRGAVTLGQVDVLRDKEAVRRTLGYLPQEFGLTPKARAEDLLDTFAVLKGITARADRRAVVEALLRKTNLWDVRRQQVGGFSGGMKRRFGIAVALLGDPKLIIVDEPTAGLDPAERGRFHNLLSEIGRDAIVILSTHIVEDVANLCPRVAVLFQGRIQLQGSPEELCDRLAPRLFRKVVAHDEVAALEAALPVISHRLRAGRHEVRVVADAAPDGFEPAPASLEDVYFAVITGRWS
ncbi:MAG: ABC transporter ATP-binding protein [Myxococcales bacterium]|nr:ABC transporter ATP-binding protein [Myxococcales bacterium]